MVGRITGEHVGKAWLYTDPDQSEPARGLPLVLDGELLVAELDAGQFVRLAQDAAATGSSPCRGNRRHRPTRR